MAVDVIREKIVTEFFLNTCQLRRLMNHYDLDALHYAVPRQSASHKKEFDVILLITGSVAEFYIEPMLPYIGDVDIMIHRSNQLAIPEGYTPPVQLPPEFSSRVQVFETVNSEFPGYVYLWLSYLLTESVDAGIYNAMQCEPVLLTRNPDHRRLKHGPALVVNSSLSFVALAPMTNAGFRIDNTRRSMDHVSCVRCLIWPPQAAHWPTRHRNYGWPDSATVNLVVSSGCDMVAVAHHLYRQDEWMDVCQWRLSFSRAEIVLLNSWMPLQQIVYHLLRRFMKTEGFITDRADTLSNYHIKTLMLWACELKSRSWWTDDLNLVEICVELLHTLVVWLSDARCQHYFINNCNLFDRFENSRYAEVTANRLMSVTRASFCEWCIDSYIHKCAEFCLVSDSGFPWDSQSGTPRDELHRIICLQAEVSAIVEYRLRSSRAMNSWQTLAAQMSITRLVSQNSLTLRSCLWCIDQLDKTDQAVQLYFSAVVFLHVASKTTQSSLTDEMLDVLATTCLQLNDARHCLNARHISVLSLSQAVKLMKVVANNSRSSVQLIEIELAKAYLHRALRCEDSDSDSIYCLTNVYLAVLYYITGQYQTAIDHCALVTRLQDHSLCSSHVVQGELLPRIDDQVDSILGLAVFYEYIRAVVLNEEQERRHVGVFTTELFAHYLHIKFLSDTKCHQLSQTSQTDEIQRYRNCVCSSPEIFVTDVIAFSFAKREKCLSNDRLVMADSGETKSLINGQLDTSKLVELLQQSAVEHLTTCRELVVRFAGSGFKAVTTEFKALYAYRCGQYQHCLQLSIRNVRALICDHSRGLLLFTWPIFIQLMDDDIVSLIGLCVLANPSHNCGDPLVFLSQLSLSLHLMTQCQIKLRHSLTSLATTLDYVHLARDRIIDNIDPSASIEQNTRLAQVEHDQLLLKFVEQKILRYISADH